MNWRKNIAAVAGILLLGGILYGHTLNVPWYLDDIRSIVENPSVHRLGTAIEEFFTSSRGIANFTFALNYSLGGTNVAGYHLVNIAIHLVTSCLVFLLLNRVFRDCLPLALGGALIFVAHPLQTQAVTYLVQRMTSLAALFFFLALYWYVRARESSENRHSPHWLFYAGALASGGLAVLIKPNTAVLPAVLLLFDRFFMPDEIRLSWKRQLRLVAPFALVPALLATKGLLLPMLTEGGINQVGGMPDLVHLEHKSPLNYLVTEFSVVWLYLRLLFIPYGQALDYDYPIVATLWTWKNLIAFLGVATLLATAAFFRKRLPIVSAGILWFFLALAVESTIIPLDPVFEHRLYIPMFGFALVVMAGIARLPGKTAFIGCVLLVGILAVLTWQRNQLWNDQIAFYEDNLNRAPRSERVHVDLANAYRKQGHFEKAESLYRRALDINPNYPLIHINLSVLYVTQREFPKAEAILLEGLRRNPFTFKFYHNLGVLYNRIGRFDRAATYLQEGAQMAPDNSSVHFNLALSLERLNRLDEAIAHYRRSLELDVDSPESHFNLGSALYKKGFRPEALEAFLTASRLDPGNAGSLYNAGMVYFELGHPASARNMAERLQRLDPGLARKLFLRITPGNDGV